MPAFSRSLAEGLLVNHRGPVSRHTLRIRAQNADQVAMMACCSRHNSSNCSYPRKGHEKVQAISPKSKLDNLEQKHAPWSIALNWATKRASAIGALIAEPFRVPMT